MKDRNSKPVPPAHFEVLEPRMLLTAAPTSVTWLSSDDTGYVNNNGVTNLNNADSSHKLGFNVAGTISGATVTLTYNGTAIGTGTGNGGTLTVYTDGNSGHTLSDGSTTISAFQTYPTNGTPSGPTTQPATFTVKTSPRPATPNAPLVTETGLSNNPAMNHYDPPLFAGSAQNNYADAYDYFLNTPIDGTGTIHLTSVIPSPSSYWQMAWYHDGHYYTISTGSGSINGFMPSTATTFDWTVPSSPSVPYDIYDLRFFAADADGNVSYSKSVKVRIDPTRPVTPSQEPSVLQAVSVSGSLVRVNAAVGDTITFGNASSNAVTLPAAVGTDSLSGANYYWRLSWYYGGYYHTQGPDYGTAATYSWTVPNHDLPSNNTFDMRLFAINAAGTLSYSEQLNLEADPKAVVDDGSHGPSYNIDEDHALTIPTATGVLSNDSDIGGHTLTAVKVTDPAHGALTLNGNGSFTYTPSTNYYGTDSFTYKANNGTADSNVATATITINSVNDPPVGTNRTVTTLEDNPYTFTASDLGFSDPSDTPSNSLLGVKITALPAFGALKDNNIAVTANQTISTADIAANKLVFTPAPNDNGTGYASFTFEVQDDGGTANGGVDTDQSPKTMTINVTPVNDPPSFTKGQDQAVNDTAGAQNVSNWATAISPGQANESSQTLNFLIDSDDNPALFCVVPSISPTGTLTFTPAPGAHGTATIGVKLHDDGGTANSGAETSAVQTFAIRVNAPPVATGDSYSTNENSPLTVAGPGVLSNDTDVDGDTLTAIKVTDPAYGVLTFNANGSFTYAPSTNWYGTDSFTYKANDGAANSNTVTVTITVPDVLAAAADSYRTNEDTPLTVAAAGVLSNDTDQASHTLSAVKVADPSHGTVALGADGSFTYTPNANWNGTDSFTYKANDGVTDSNTVVVNIAVDSVNDAPSGTDNTVTTTEDVPYAFTVSDFGFSDPNDSPPSALLGVKIATPPAVGSLTNNGTAVAAGQTISAADISAGKLVFTPAINANGVGYASFTFQVQDNGGTANGGTDVASAANTLTLNVTPSPIVSWDGGGNDLLWTNPQNWSTDTVPGALDDVIIGAGGGVITLNSGSQTIKNLNCARGLAISSGSLTINYSATFGNSVSVSTTLSVANGLALSGQITVGSSAYFYLKGTQAVSGSGSIVLSGTQSKLFASGVIGAPANVTLGSGITVSGQGSILGSSSGDTLTNNGAITCSSGLLDIGSYSYNHLTFVNNGTMQASSGGSLDAITPLKNSNSGQLLVSGGTMYLEGTWTSSGSMSVTAGDLELQGSFRTADLANVTCAGGTVSIAGILDNSGATLDLGGQAGWMLYGTIQNGTVRGSGYISAWGGKIDGVTLDECLRVNPMTSLTVVNNLSLNATITVNGSGSQNVGAVEFQGSQMVSGSGQIVLASDNSRLKASGTKVELGSGITVSGQGRILGGYAGDELVNNGTIIGSGGVLYISDSQYNNLAFTNNGTLQVNSGGTVEVMTPLTNSSSGQILVSGGTMYLNGTWAYGGNMTVTAGDLELKGDFATVSVANINCIGGSVTIGGTLHNTGSTLALGNQTGWVLSYPSGTISGGTITGNGYITAYSGTLDGVTLGESVQVDPIGTLMVMDGLTLNNVTITINGNGRDKGAVKLQGSQTITGNGQISLASGNSILEVMGTSDSIPATITLGSGITVSGLGSILGTYAHDTLVNNGVISGALNIGSYLYGHLAFVNNGALQVNSGTLLAIAPLTNSSGGQVLVGGGTLYLYGDWANSGSINVTAGYLSSGSGTWHSTGTMVVSGSGEMALTGTWNSGGTMNLSGTATLTLGGSWSNTGVLAVDGGTLVLEGSLTTAGLGAIAQTGGTVTLAGTLNNANSVLTLTSLWNMTGGKIQGGTVDAAVDASGHPEGSITVGGTGWLIGGVQLGANLLVTVPTNATVYVDGDMELQGSINLAGSGSELCFCGNAAIPRNLSLSGTGFILMQNSASFIRVGRPTDALTQLTSTGITIDGGGVIMDSPGKGTLVNRGTIRTSQKTLSIATGTFSNEGTLYLWGQASMDIQGTTISLDAQPISGTEAELTYTGLDPSGTISVQDSIDVGATYQNVAAQTRASVTLVGDLVRNRTQQFLVTYLDSGDPGQVVFAPPFVTTSDEPSQSGWYRVSQVQACTGLAGTPLVPMDLSTLPIDSGEIRADSAQGFFVLAISDVASLVDAYLAGQTNFAFAAAAKGQSLDSSNSAGEMNSVLSNTYTPDCPYLDFYVMRPAFTDGYYYRASWEQSPETDNDRWLDGTNTWNYPLGSIKVSYSEGGGDNGPGVAFFDNPNAMGGKSGTSNYSDDPIRYYDGSVSYQTTDLQSNGFGRPFGQTLSWTNRSQFVTDDRNGNGMVETDLPSLKSLNQGDTVEVVENGTDVRVFNLVNGSYVPASCVADKLRHQSGEFIFTDTSGNEVHFFDFSATVEAQRGQFKSRRDASGILTYVYSWTTGGEIQEIRRQDASGLDGESWLYSYLPTSDSNHGKVHSTELRRPDGSGGWQVVEQVEYDYYGRNEAHGMLGDLKTETIQDAAGNAIDTKYYRYYTFAEEGGYTDGLKYVFDSNSFARLSAAVADPFTATDAQAAPYATQYFEYDSEHRVTRHDVQGAGSSSDGGIGTFTYSYETSDNPPGPNSWTYKTTETLPDGNQNIVYCNNLGDVMLKVFCDNVDSANPALAGKQWLTFYKYDNDGRLLWTADPSAVTGYDESYPDLLNLQDGNYQYLADDAGLIHVTQYDASTTATQTTAGDVAGYVKADLVQHGETGSVILLDSQDYYVRTAGSVTTYPVAHYTVYRSEGGLNASTASYAYTWYVNTVQMQSRTTTLPVVTGAENGSGTAAQVVDLFDAYGNVIWSKDADGFITHTEYDPGTGAVTEYIQDASTSLPAGWSAPVGGGLNVTTGFEVDALGRTTKKTSPRGTVTYIVYDDIHHEIRTYPGWDSSTGRPIGPISIVRVDESGDYVETMAMSAIPTLDSDGRPTGQESISGIQSLARIFYNTGGQIVEDREYFNLGSLTYSTDPNLGEAGINYLSTAYAYNLNGQKDRERKPDGTVLRVEMDSLGREVSTWTGTDDAPEDTNRPWSPDNNGGNMVELSAAVYDGGGVGDGNVTSITQFADADDHYTTEYAYDWRDRRTDSRGPDSVAAKTTYDNLGSVTETRTYVDSDQDFTIDSGELRSQNETLYDGLGRTYENIAHEIDPSSGVIGDHLTSRTWYDANGWVIKTADSNGLFHKIIYDGAGRAIVSATSYDSNESNTDYAAASNVDGDTVIDEVKTFYDKDGNAIAVLNFQRLENDTTTTGDLTASNSYATASANWYDALDRLTHTANYGHEGGSGTRYVFDADGNVIDVNANGIPDEAEGPERQPDTSDDYIASAFAYDAAGRACSTTDNAGHITETFFDLLGRTTSTIANFTGDGTVSETTPSDVNQTMQYVYDASGRLAIQRALNPQGQGNGVLEQDTRYLYESPLDGSLVTSVIYPDSSNIDSNGTDQIKTTYDRLGRKTSVTDQRGTVHTYSYDSTGRLSSDTVTSLGNSNQNVDGSVRRVEYGYNSLGRISTVSSYDAVSGGNIVNQIAYDYDGWGNIVQEKQSHNGPVDANTPVVIYTYSDGASDGQAKYIRLIHVAYPGGQVVEYDYGQSGSIDDVLGRVASVTDGSETTYAQYGYLGEETIVQVAHPDVSGNLVLSYGSNGNYTGLDRFGRLTGQTWTVDGTAVDSYSYTYDSDSNCISRSNQLNSSLSETYAYDGLNRLIDTNRNGSDYQALELDAVGNWTSSTDQGSTQSRTANAANEITSVSGQATPTYDAAGNLTFDGSFHYTYDAWNQLVKVNADDPNNAGQPGEVVATYQYDGQGRRISKTTGSVSTVTTDYYYDVDKQVVEERQGGQVSAQYVWDLQYIDTPVCRITPAVGGGTQTLYYTTDGNANVTALVNTAGQVVERYAYDPYGNVTVFDGSWNVLSGGSAYGNEILYKGYRYNPETGNYQVRSREYSPSLGNWLQRDPAGYVDGGNLYAAYFVPNGVDPSGLSSWWNGAVSWVTTGSWREDADAGEIASAYGHGFAQGAAAGALNVAQKLTLGQIDAINRARDKAWRCSGLAGTWVELASDAAAQIGMYALCEAGAAYATSLAMGRAATTIVKETASTVAEDTATEMATTAEEEVVSTGRGMSNPNTARSANMGNRVHYDQLNGGQGEQLPTRLSEQHPDTEFEYARRGEAGPDVRVTGGTHPSEYPGSNWKPGNDFGEFKPNTDSGAKAFARSIKNGRLPENTQHLPYDPVTGKPAWSGKEPI